MGLRGASPRFRGPVRTRANVDSVAGKIEPPTPPAPPEGMGDAALAHWRRLAVRLHAAGALTGLDVEALRLLCDTLALIDEIDAQLKGAPLLVEFQNKGGGVNLVANPLLRLRAQAHSQAAQMLKAFGCVPSVRGVKGIRPDEVPETEEEARVAAILDAERRTYFS